MLDRYGYDLGAAGRAGPETAQLRIACDWQGPAPAICPVAVRGRAGCDRAPIDVTDPAARAGLLSFVWPDQPARRARTEAALALAAVDPPPVERAEAADWVETRLARRPGRAPRGC